MEETKIFHPQAVLLDMDGLMLDTERPTFELWNPVGRTFGYDIQPEMVFSMMGLSEKGIYTLFVNKYGKDFPYDEIRNEVKRRARKKFEDDGIALRPGLMTLLDCLAQRKIPCAVATSTDRERAEWKLDRTGIKSFFSAMVYGDEIANGKPAPDIFLTAASKLGIPPGDCVGFEDSGPGLLALNAAGIPSVFIRDLAQPSPEALATVWRQYSSLAEAAEIFV
jgi:HAD superfamily hydrolase (TIGR01509 family)